MARSSSVDSVEKFRFRVKILDMSIIDSILSTPVLAAGDLFLRGKFKTFTRAGFSEVSTPKLTVNEISYRENIDNQRFSKIPGLVKYDPIVLKRGITTNKDLFEWYRLVNNDMGLLGVAQELNNASKSPPIQNENFRRDVNIEILDRTGNVVKTWVLFNAWPSSYKAGSDLAADAEEKSIEELTLTYEFFIELAGGESLENLKVKDLISSAATSTLDTFSNAFGNNLPPFLR